MMLTDKGKMAMIQHRASVARIAFLVFACALSLPAFGFSILSVDATRDSEVSVAANVTAEIEFTPTVIEALESSIPITIRTNIKVYRVRKNMWDQLVCEYDSRDEVSYRSLYRTYRMRMRGSNIVREYDSLDEALGAIGDGRLHNLVLENAQFDSEETYIGKVRISLDRTALPSVMRVPVFFKNSWRLQSDRFEFDVK